MKTSSKITLAFFAFVFAIVFIIIISSLALDDTTNETDSTSIASVTEADGLPSEETLLQDAKEILRKTYHDAVLLESEGYNVVKPQYNKTAKVEGYVIIEGDECSYTVIFQFNDDFTTYESKYLQIDKKVIYDKRQPLA